MSAWLIELSFGPVQGFIASARRSRDLWAGSHMLSEVVRAAAGRLLDDGATLIYPIASRVQRENAGEDSNLSNVILARVEAADAAAVSGVCERARQAARARFAEFSSLAAADWRSVGVREALWKRQVEVALECYAAWSRLDEAGYRPAYEAVKGALVARKNTRDFAPLYPEPALRQAAFGLPKSSLDGANESVLPENRQFSRRFGLSPGEQLDALGCIKRTVGRDERFTALTRLAAHPWLARLDAAERRALAAAYEPLVGAELATRCGGNANAYADFPYDGALLFESRLQNARQAAADDPGAQQGLDALADRLRPLWRKYGRPNPYMAFVVADGDRMGGFIDKAQSEDEHREISAAVARFADRVPAIAREHGGHSVFNGGEDLTVLFPLDGLLPGAQALAAAFAEAMAPLVQRFVPRGLDPADAPTLRVGAAICHVQEPLGVIRMHADAAEKFAKGEAGITGQGNALGLCLHVRAGHVLRKRLRFDDPAAFDRLRHWMQAYAGASGAKALPGRLGYDMRGIAAQQQRWQPADGDARALAVAGQVAMAEFKRLLDRINQGGGQQAVDEAQRRQLLHGIESMDAAMPIAQRLAVLGDELVLARWLSATSASEIREQEGR